MQPTVTNQCGAHYDIALQLHPLSTTAAQPSWHQCSFRYRQAQLQSFQLETSRRGVATFLRYVLHALLRWYSEIEISNFNFQLQTCRRLSSVLFPRLFSSSSSSVSSRRLREAELREDSTRVKVQSPTKLLILPFVFFQPQWASYSRTSE